MSANDKSMANATAGVNGKRHRAEMVNDGIVGFENSSLNWVNERSTKVNTSRNVGKSDVFADEMENESDIISCSIERELIPGCDPKQFSRIVAAVSKERINAIVDMGFGPVDMLGCRELNLPLCKMLLDNVNVKEQTIRIHGRHLSITEKDFQRLMGLRCRGIEVDINCSLEDDVVGEWKSRICGNDADISLGKLIEVILSTKSDALFMVSFGLYALATMFCPSRPGYVDPRLLIPLKDPLAIRRSNWSRFAYTKLLEAVTTYQVSQIPHVGGCLVLLQLFYLNVLGERTLMVPMIEGPVMSFGLNECNQIFKWIEGLGGFEATEGVWVTKRHTAAISTSISGSRDCSTGLKTNLVDDVSGLKKNMVVLEQGVARLESFARRMGPDIAYMREAMKELQHTVANKFDEHMDDFVDEVESAVLASLEARAAPTIERRETDRIYFELGGLSNTSRDKLPKTTVHASQPHYTGSEVHSVRVAKTKYGTVADLSAEDKELIMYLHSLKSRGGDILGSDKIGRYRGFSVSVWDLKCLSAQNCISSEIINLIGAYCFANAEEQWFFPTHFSERAQQVVMEDCMAGHISSTITLCKLRRYNGRLHDCKKIFIPISDGSVPHWFLAVLKIEEGECEIWDSKPDISALQRREQMVASVIRLIRMVFARELKGFRELDSKLASYHLSYPELNPTRASGNDSGIFTIRTMQHYGDCWHEGFNSGDQRVRLVLEIVNNPLNECLEEVWEGVFSTWKSRPSYYHDVPNWSGDAVGDGKSDGSSVPCTIKFKPCVPRRS